MSTLSKNTACLKRCFFEEFIINWNNKILITVTLINEFLEKFNALFTTALINNTELFSVAEKRSIKQKHRQCSPLSIFYSGTRQN